ncbi:alpha/beta fold hydrolase [Billgrantia kenyensis]|uniref:Alpha/beta hydrolase n=1 Tax=Billgrantia kenyensis TaxID=321266 RepID=A0A7V9W084_9GAMM|nr:alpha/beta hydrolase [Halomonas kenyensis]MBA2778637.1 alpha/beta hydrolase [Halomonas kenyensis]MCG6661558.1 alpha/beta hydrolase [Halomonas kenyensis]
MEAFTLDSPAGGIFAARWRPVGESTRGQPIVLLHDSLGCVSLWRDFPERLAAATGREVIAYDRLGYGRSAPFPGTQPGSFIADEPRGAFATLLEQLGLKGFVALGHSVGGGMAVEVAGAYPGACQALITVSAQAFVEPRTLTGIREAEQALVEPGGLSRLAKYHGDKAEWALRSWVDNWHSEAFRDWTLDAALARVACPTLAIHGEHDEYGSLEQPWRISRLTPGPQAPAILPCGHVPHRECPERLTALVVDFLADTP